MRRVAAFAARRAAAAVSLLLVVVGLTFAIFWTVPSTPARFLYPHAQYVSREQVARADRLLGLDRPKLVQVGDYVWHLARGDFGRAWSGATVDQEQRLVARPVRQELLAATRLTLSIVVGGALLTVLLAVPLGCLAGRFESSALDRALSLVTLLGICTHAMVIGLLLRTVFGDRLHWLPPTGYCTFGREAAPAQGIVPVPGVGDVPCGGPLAWAQHLLLPWLTFALVFLALYTRMVRASVVEGLREDWVRTARAKGSSETRVVLRHVLPNASLRILTMVGMEIGTALGIAVYVESAFGLPGLGRLAVSVFVGTVGLDLPYILGVVVVVTAIVLGANLAVEIVYAAIDPRAGEALRARRVRGAAGTLT